MSTDASIASLVDLTALSAEQASTLLAAAGGDLDLAVALHFDDTTLPFLPAAEPPPPAVEELSDGFGLFSLLDGVDDAGARVGFECDLRPEPCARRDEGVRRRAEQ